MKKFVLSAIIILAFVLRVYNLAKDPPSLYWDEASLGYNAYSILKTGRDEHGKLLPLTNFAAFGDYKPPGYIYATVPSIAIFDLTEFAIRFPSAFFGTLTVILTYLLALKLFGSQKIALFSSFLLAISPWHLQMSRAAFEANLALFFSVFGIYAFVKFATDRPIYLWISAASFLVAIYTFTGQRLFVPFILLILLFQFRKQILANLKFVIVTLTVAILLFWPLFKFSTQTIEGRLRFNEVTIFRDLKPIDDSIKYRERNNFAWWSNIIHNRRVFYAREYLKHYFDAFNPPFLFVKGDINPRLSIQEVGELYYFDLILIIIGIYFLFATKQRYRFLIVSWLFISPLGPATARETPHALRMIHIIPTYQLIAAYGFYNLFNLIKSKRILLTFPFLIFTFLLFYYLHMYYFHYPNEYSGQWQYGYKQAVETVKSYYQSVDSVFVTEGLGRSYIYFLFYLGYDPRFYWQTSEVARDEFFFLDVKKFDKFHFGDIESFSKAGKNLYVVAPHQLPGFTDKITTIENLKGEPVFDIGITQ